MDLMPRPIMATVYAFVALHGIVTVGNPSQPVASILGEGIVYIYGFSFIFFGVAAFVSILRPNFKIEAVALWPLFGAYALYDVALWTLVADQYALGEALPAIYGPAFSVGILSIIFLGTAIRLQVKTQQLLREAATHDNR